MADSVPEVLSCVLAEIQAGEGLTPSAGRLFPGHRGGESIDPSTVFRWATRGTRAPGGVLVRLETIRAGGRWLTSRGAIARFVAALTDAARPSPEAGPPAPRTATARRKAADRAVEQLKKMGA